jgi:hypothetical protein
MILQVPVTPETEAALRERASARGEDVAAYAARLLHEAATGPDVDQLLAPFRRQVAESGATDEELDEFFDELRQDVWAERQAPKAKNA